MRQTYLKGFPRIDKDIQISPYFKLQLRYLDYIFSLNNSRFGDYLHLIYPNVLEIKDIIASYLDSHIETDNGGKL